MSNPQTFYVVSISGKKANEHMSSDKRILLDHCNIQFVDYIQRIMYVACNDNQYQIKYVVKGKDYYDNDLRIRNAKHFLQRISCNEETDST